MSNNFLFDLSVYLFQYTEQILSSHIHNWSKLDFAHKAAWFFWGCVSVAFYTIFYGALLFIAIKFFPIVINTCLNRSNEAEKKENH